MHGIAFGARLLEGRNFKVRNAWDRSTCAAGTATGPRVELTDIHQVADDGTFSDREESARESPKNVAVVGAMDEIRALFRQHSFHARGVHLRVLQHALHVVGSSFHPQLLRLGFTARFVCLLVRRPDE